MFDPLSLVPKLYIGVALVCRVKNWALKFGVDLWEFGKQVTKMTEIQRVRSKNGPAAAAFSDQ